MTRLHGALLFALVVVGPGAALAGNDEEPNLDFFYPLVTRRPVIERELEVRLSHDPGRGARRTEGAAAIELPLLPRWQVELEMPVVFNDPREAKGTAGPGDLEVQHKFLLLKSVALRALVATGFEARLPSGSARRSLGGEAALEPFVAAAIALGDFDVLADAAYEWNVNAHARGEREQELGAGVAVGYRALRHLTPLVEIVTATRTRGEDDAAGAPRGATQVYVVPGFNVRPVPGTTARFGLQLPLTRARRADYTLHGGLVWEF